MAGVRFRLDPWPADYQSPVQIEEIPGSSAEVDPEVETARWQALRPIGAGRPDQIYFVDGVMRVEARVLADSESGAIIHGLLGTIGTGAVSVDQAAASFRDIEVKHCAIMGSGELPESLSVRIADKVVSFEPFAAIGADANVPSNELRNQMRELEARLAERLASSSACVFADGPLTYHAFTDRPTIGIIKRLFEPYLSLSHFKLVRRLSIGERTPVFAINDGKHDRLSWYLRAGTPRIMDHDLAGVLRLEVRSGVGKQKAFELANLSVACIPQFAGDSIRDPRSPQNLLPIGALERELRRRLGDMVALRRAIEAALFEQRRE